jgi:diguanylate cyclase (GGDEF)-like protein
MQPERQADADALPLTRQELQVWIGRHLKLPTELEALLLAGIDLVITRQEQLWQTSKQEAVRALSAGFADTVTRLKDELSARDATVQSISEYFERLVVDLSDKARRDAKTNLINFARFQQQLEAFLATEQRGRWCVVGLVDIAEFKRLNDTFGHMVGDRIIERIANLLREQVRSRDLVAQERSEDGHGLHARLGGDEFCFLISDLVHYQQIHPICERFHRAVREHDWHAIDERLVERPIRVDIGVVCLRLGRLSDRRFIARRLAAGLIEHADALMYRAKADRQQPVYVKCLQLVDGEFVTIAVDDDGVARDVMAT